MYTGTNGWHEQKLSHPGSIEFQRQQITRNTYQAIVQRGVDGFCCGTALLHNFLAAREQPIDILTLLFEGIRQLAETQAGLILQQLTPLLACTISCDQRQIQAERMSVSRTDRRISVPVVPDPTTPVPVDLHRRRRNAGRMQQPAESKTLPPF